MTITPSDFEFIRDFLHKESAIVLDPGKEYLVESRLVPVAEAHNLGSIPELVERLRSKAETELRAGVVDAMTTNETSFFRDRHPFDALRDEIIPSLLSARQEQKQLHIWCGASSTGQEPYTIAMVLADNFPALSGWDVKISATDLSAEVLAKARAGLFSQLEVNRGLPATLLAKHFEQEGISWRIRSHIRDLVDFKQMNLATDWVMPPADVVFMRNVLIYFDVETKQKILAGVRRTLRPDGFLFLGSAETTLGLSDEFDRETFEKAAYYRPKAGSAVSRP